MKYVKVILQDGGTFQVDIAQVGDWIQAVKNECFARQQPYPRAIKDLYIYDTEHPPVEDPPEIKIRECCG